MIFQNKFLPVLILCAYCVTAVSQINENAPMVAVESTQWNFGTVKQGTKVEKVFAVRNEGTSTLLIEEVKFSMNGMNISTKQKIAPGATEDLHISWDTSGFSQNVEGLVLLQFNDPKHPQVVFSLVGTVLAPIQISPRPAFYMSQFRGEQKSRVITIRNNQERDVLITKIEPNGTHFIASVITEKSGKLYQLKVTVPPDTEVGRFRESVLIHTDDPIRKRISIQVNVLVKPDIYLSPDSIDFGRISKSTITTKKGLLDLLQQTITITRRKGEMTIKSIKSDISFLNFDLTPPSKAQIFRLDSKLVPEKIQLGKFTGSVILKTDDSDFPKLNIPVTGTVVE